MTGQLPVAHPPHLRIPLLRLLHSFPTPPPPPLRTRRSLLLTLSRLEVGCHCRCLTGWERAGHESHPWRLSDHRCHPTFCWRAVLEVGSPVMDCSPGLRVCPTGVLCLVMDRVAPSTASMALLAAAAYVCGGWRGSSCVETLTALLWAA